MSTLFGEADTVKAATISGCGRYRYTLSRRWDEGLSFATFIMLNPSTADADLDDPTIRRCIGFARAWGASALRVVNVYAYRATDPKDMKRAADPVGPENDYHLADHAMSALQNGLPLVAAWGVNADPARVRQVLALPGMTALSSLGVTRDGHPRHPLYLPASAERAPWPVQP